MQKAIADPDRRTPPNRAGAFAFRQARLTAFGLIVLVPYALFVLAHLAGQDLATVRAMLSQPATAIALTALVLIGAFHMWLGMREILEDYLRKPALSFWLGLNTLFTLVIVLAAGGAMVRFLVWG